MGIGPRLRQLRKERNFSQGDLEERTGLLRCYISRIEGGHTVPALQRLEKIARALDLELYQLFYAGKGKPSAASVRPPSRLPGQERKLVEMFRRLTAADQKLVSSLTRYASRRRPGI